MLYLGKIWTVPFHSALPREMEQSKFYLAIIFLPFHSEPLNICILLFNWCLFCNNKCSCDCCGCALIWFATKWASRFKRNPTIAVLLKKTSIITPCVSTTVNFYISSTMVSMSTITKQPKLCQRYQGHISRGCLLIIILVGTNVYGLALTKHTAKHYMGLHTMHPLWC